MKEKVLGIYTNSTEQAGLVSCFSLTGFMPCKLHCEAASPITSMFLLGANLYKPSKDGSSTGGV